MLQIRTLKGLAPLLALSAVVFTTGCANKEIANSHRPALFRVTPPPATEIPDGSVPCPSPGNPGAMCLSDEENGDLLIEYESGERERDRMLCWLRVWFGYPACPVD